MRRRHKAQYAAHERAHLAPSMPHVRRDQRLPGAQLNPLQPTLLYRRRRKDSHLKAAERKTRLSSNLQVSKRPHIGSNRLKDSESVMSVLHRTASSLTTAVNLENTNTVTTSVSEQPDSGRLKLSRLVKGHRGPCVPGNISI